MTLRLFIPVAIAVASVLASCSEAGSSFSSIKGSRWRLKAPVTLEEIGEPYFGKMCDEQFVKDFAAGRRFRNPLGGGFRVVAVLPTGTIVQVEKLVSNGITEGGYSVHMSVQSGPDTGKYFTAPDEFFLPNTFNASGISKSTTWDVDPKTLEKP